MLPPHPPSELPEPEPVPEPVPVPAGAAAVSPLPHGPVVPRRVWTAGSLTYTTAGLVTLFALLLGGDFALSMRERSVVPLMQLMLGRLHASDPLMFFLITELPAALSLLVVPVASSKSDGLRTRWGRRVPYLLVATPIAAGCMGVLAYGEPLGTAAARASGHPAAAAGWSLAVFGVAWTAFECAALASVALMGGLVNDVVPRPVLGRFYGLFRAVSLVAGMIFNHWGMRHADVHGRGILLGMGALFLVGFTVMCLTVREGTYPPPSAPDSGAGATVGAILSRRWSAVVGYLSDSFTHRYYWLVFAGLTLGGVALTPINVVSILYAKQLNLSTGAYGDLLTATYAVSLSLAWPLGWLVDRFRALTVATVALGTYAAAVAVGGIGIVGPRSFAAAFIAHGVLSGCYFTAVASLGQALFPRLKYGQFASAAGIVSAVVTITFSAALGWLLQRSGHQYRLTFGVAAATCVPAVACLIAIGRSTPPADDGGRQAS